MAPQAPDFRPDFVAATSLLGGYRVSIMTGQYSNRTLKTLAK